MKKLIVGLNIMVFMCIGAINANAVVIDFEEIDNTAGNAFSGYSLDTQGFNFLNDYISSSAILHWYRYSSSNADQDGVTYSHNYGGSTTTVTQINGEAFDLVSFDIGNVYDYSPYVQSFVITGYLYGGGSTSTTFTSDANSGLETISLGWTNLASFTFTESTGTWLQTDNFVINESFQPVPEPASMLLIGTGIAGLVGARIRRKKK